MKKLHIMKKIVLQDPKNIIALRPFAIIRSFMTVMVLFLFAFHSSGQVAINEDDSDADADAALDIKSTTKGVIFPKLSETERDTLPSPATGLLIYNRTVGYFNYYNGNKWCRIERSVAIDPATNPSGSENDNGTGVGIEDPDNSAILHVNSNAKGFLMPRLTADISSTTEGMIYHNNNYFRFYNGTEWTDIAGPVEGDGDTGTADAEGVVIGKSSIDQSAKMEVYSADKGLLIPRMTSTQRNDINSPAEGLLIYNTDDHAFQYYADSKWYSWVNDLSEYGTEYYPGISCDDILTKRPTASDGYYWIDPDSTAGSTDAFECYCDMTSDDGGWTLATSSYGNPPDNLFTTTTSNRDPSSGNVYTDLTIGNGNWYSHLRWGPASARSTDWSNVAYPIYNRQTSEVNTWFQAVGQGGSPFTPAIDYKCNWVDSYVSLSSTSSNYNDQFPSSSWNIPNPPGGSSWDGVLPGINLGNGETLSDSHGVGGIDCNPGDARTDYIQLWVK